MFSGKKLLALYSSTVILFSCLFMLPVQKDTLFKMLNNEIVYTIYKMSIKDAKP